MLSCFVYSAFNVDKVRECHCYTKHELIHMIPFLPIGMIGHIFLYKSYHYFKEYACNYCMLWFYFSYKYHFIILLL